MENEYNIDKFVRYEVLDSAWDGVKGEVTGEVLDKMAVNVWNEVKDELYYKVKEAV